MRKKHVCNHLKMLNCCDTLKCLHTPLTYCTVLPMGLSVYRLLVILFDLVTGCTSMLHSAWFRVAFAGAAVGEIPEPRLGSWVILLVSRHISTRFQDAWRKDSVRRQPWHEHREHHWAGTGVSWRQRGESTEASDKGEINAAKCCQHSKPADIHLAIWSIYQGQLREFTHR